MMPRSTQWYCKVGFLTNANLYFANVKPCRVLFQPNASYAQLKLRTFSWKWNIHKWRLLRCFIVVNSFVRPVVALRDRYVNRSSRPEVFCKKGILRNFSKLTGKNLCQRLFFNKVVGLQFYQKRVSGSEDISYLDTLLYLKNFK